MYLGEIMVCSEQSNLRLRWTDNGLGAGTWFLLWHVLSKWQGCS